MTEPIARDYADLLSGVDLFAGLSRLTLAQLAAHLEPVAVEDGSVIFEQGEEGDALYIVAAGRLEVVATAQNQMETRLNILAAGDCVGEMALVTGQPRSATVRARGATTVLRLDRDRFVDLVRKEPTVAQSVISVIADRLRSADRARAEADAAVREAVDRALAALPGDERLLLLEASVLPTITPAVLRAVFGERSETVSADLEGLASAGAQASTAFLHVLRERFEREVPAAAVHRFEAEAAQRLADAGLWDDALGILARRADREEFRSTLGRALRAVPPLEATGARRWIEPLSDAEVAADPEVALAAAAIHEERGDRAAATRVLERGLGAALVSGDPGAGQRLTEAISRVTSGEDTTPVVRFHPSLLALRGRPHLPTMQTALAVGIATALTVGAAMVRGEHPLGAFILLLGAAVALWNSNLLPDFAVSLALAGAWVLWGIARPADAVAGFATMDWVFVLAVLGLAAGVARSGLLFRVGLLLVRRMPRGLVWQALVLLLTGVLLSPLLPEPRGRAALVAPLALAMAQASRLRDRDAGSAVLGLAAWIGSGPLMFLFLNASPVCLLAWGLLPPETRGRFDWLTWLLAALPLGVIVGLGGLGVLFLLLRPRVEAPPTRERVNLQLAVLGPLSGREGVMTLILLATVMGWFFAPTLEVHVGVVAVLGLFAAAAAGAFDQRSLREMDWGFLIYYGVALSVQHVSARVGVGEAASRIAGQGFGGSDGFGMLAMGPLLFLIVVGAVSVLARFVLEASQTVLLLSLAFLPAAAALGISPWLVAIVLLATNNPWFTLKQTPAYEVASVAAEGRLFAPEQGRVVAIGFAAITLAAFVLLTPYWRLLGLL